MVQVAKPCVRRWPIGTLDEKFKSHFGGYMRKTEVLCMMDEIQYVFFVK